MVGTLDKSLTALAGYDTTRVATPGTVEITQEHLTRTLTAAFPTLSTADTAVKEWCTAHADLNWANLTAPRCWMLDWEDWGRAPRGLDAANLWACSLAVPGLAGAHRGSRRPQRMRPELGRSARWAGGKPGCPPLPTRGRLLARRTDSCPTGSRHLPRTGRRVTWRRPALPPDQEPGPDHQHLRYRHIRGLGGGDLGEPARVPGGDAPAVAPPGRSELGDRLRCAGYPQRGVQGEPGPVVRAGWLGARTRGVCA